MIWPRHHLDAGAILIESFNYTLDNAGNRLRVDNSDGSYTVWGYDNAHRLTGETQFDTLGVQTSATTFSYDATGNRTQMMSDGVTTGYSYNALDQLTTQISGTTSIDYAYDLNGNLTSATEKDNGITIATTTTTWDAMGRLQTATTPTAGVAYAYDHDGRRTGQTVNGTDVTRYLWDEFSTYGDVVLEYDGANSLLTRYTRDNAQPLAQTQGGSTHYYLSDGQRSTRLLTDSLGNVSDTYSYTAFGELLTQTGATSNSYLYTGQWYDALTEQYNLRARSYSPSTGRFLSRDAWEIDYHYPLELNRYVYAAANPVLYSDPSGYAALVENRTLGIVLLAATGASICSANPACSANLYNASGAIYALLEEALSQTIGRLIDVLRSDDVDVEQQQGVLTVPWVVPWIVAENDPQPDPEPEKQPQPECCVIPPDDPEQLITVYRVESDLNQHISISIGGIVTIIGDDSAVLWLNFGQRARAEEFALKRVQQGFPNVMIKSFKVPMEFYILLQSTAVSERQARRRENRHLPIISNDPPKGTQLGLREPQILALRSVIRQGTGQQERRP